MTIHSIDEISRERRVTIKTTHKGIDYNFTVKVKDGIMQGDYKHGFATSTLSYFNYPDEIRIKHWKQVKKEVEEAFKSDLKFS